MTLMRMMKMKTYRYITAEEAEEYIFLNCDIPDKILPPITWKEFSDIVWRIFELEYVIYNDWAATHALPK